MEAWGSADGVLCRSIKPLHKPKVVHREGDSAFDVAQYDPREALHLDVIFCIWVSDLELYHIYVNKKYKSKSF